MRRRWLVGGMLALMAAGACFAVMRRSEPDLFAPFRERATRGFTDYVRRHRTPYKSDFVVVPQPVENVLAELRPELDKGGWDTDVRTNGSWGRFTRLRHGAPDEVLVSGFRFEGTSYTTMRAKYRLDFFESAFARVTPRPVLWQKGQ